MGNTGRLRSYDQTSGALINPMTGQPYTGTPAATSTPSQGYSSDGSIQIWNPVTQSWHTPSTLQNKGPANTPASSYVRGPDPRPAADAAKAAADTEAQNKTNEQNALKAQTTRTLELLRQQLTQGTRYGTNALRANLAQRGLLDSGSLGAGIGRLNQQYGQQMAQGTMLAANNETDNLMKLLEAEKNRQFQAQQNAANNQALMARMAEEARLQRAGQPSGFEQFLGGVGSAAGQALPFLLMGA